MRKFQNNQLQSRYETDEAFRKKANHKQQQYLVLRKKANEMKKEQIINESFIQKFRSKDNRVIYFLYGYLQPQPGKSTTIFTLNFIHHFKPQVDERFSIAYFNELTPSSDYFKQFKNIFFLLPFSILQKMDDFVLVKPTFYLKAMNYLTIEKTVKLFDKCYSHVDNCKQLCEKLKIQVQDFISFVPEQYTAQFPQKFKRNVSLHNYRVNYYGQNLTESMRFDKQEFQKTVNALISKQVYTIENYELGNLGIPVVLQILIFYFTSQPEGLCAQGIFRKSVAIDEEQRTLAQLSQRNYEYIEQIMDPHLVASLIKKFFYNLKEPIIPFHLFKELMDDQKANDKRQHLKVVISKLTTLNFATLIFLIEFLKKDVISRQKENKMSANNIAICFSPCLMKSQVSSMADLVYATKSVNYTVLLINEFDYIFGDKQVRLNLFKSKIIEQNQVFQQTIRQELHFDQLDQQDVQLKQGFIIRQTQSYALKQDGTVQELYLKQSTIQDSVINGSFNKQNQSFNREILSTRKISDKIDQISSQIKSIQKSHNQSKKSGDSFQYKNVNNSVVNVQVDNIDQTVFIQLELEDQEKIPSPVKESLTKSKISLSYSKSVDVNEPQKKVEQGLKAQKKKSMLTWQQLKKCE